MTVSQQLRSIAATIRPYETGTPLRMESLANALESPEIPAEWLELDPMAYISPEVVATGIRNSHRRSMTIARVERLRNLLVLVPVFLTWLGLAYAAVGYASVATTNPELLTQPFLLLWERSFYGLAPFPASTLSFLTLSTVAIVDMVTIAVVLCLTWVIHSEVNVRQELRNDVAETVRANVATINWRAAMELSRRRVERDAPETIQRIGEALVEGLRLERERIEALRADREQEATVLAQAAHDLEAGAVAMVTMTAGLRHAATTAEIVATKIDERLTSGISAISTAANAILDLRAPMVEAAEATRAGADSVRESMALVADSSDRSLPVTGALAAAVAALTADVGTLRSTLFEQGRASQALLEEARLEAVDLSTAVVQLESQLGRLTLGVETLKSGFEQLSTQQSTAASTAQQQHESSKALAAALTAVQSAVADLSRVGQLMDQRLLILTSAVPVAPDGPQTLPPHSPPADEDRSGLSRFLGGR